MYGKLKGYLYFFLFFSQFESLCVLKIEQMRLKWTYGSDAQVILSFSNA